MKKYILFIISVLLLINVFFPKTFMGRIYLKDFEQRCFERNYYDATIYDALCNAPFAKWEENADISWFKTDLEGTVICVATSYGIDCYFYEDVNDKGVIWCTVDGYVNGNVIVGAYREYGALTEIEGKAQREAIKTFNSQIDVMTRKKIDKLYTKRNITLIFVCAVWCVYFLISAIMKNMSKKADIINDADDVSVDL